ncbi:MAG: nucleotidyltransferase family protein [Candidatus Asgardarchaeum sp.]
MHSYYIGINIITRKQEIYCKEKLHMVIKITIITKEKVLEILRKELPYLRKKYKVKRIGVFGSFARNEQTFESDIDILVEFEKPIGLFKFIELEWYLSEKLGRKVDLVTHNALKPLIRDKVLSELIYV